ncbi:hypothetical protein WIS52_06700 [Pseudonocardia nematodicida]|uniref:RiboL-PSP-HEPN domain-containing protein n=1 Tax=Pseudonocardia nematodicida TaxID=1206997 RepID=A0ABV1K6N4_9PSEU
MPAFSVIAKIGAPGSADRLREIGRAPATRREPDNVAHAFATTGDGPADNLRRNLEYARSLAEAGNLLNRLQAGSFDPDDMFRAAWTQAVTALDWWVAQEVRARILDLVAEDGTAVPDRLRRKEIPFAVLDDVRSGTRSVAEAVAEHFLDGKFSRQSYQGHEAIGEGFGLVLPSTTKLWPSVVKVLNEQAPGGTDSTLASVKDRLTEVAQRRHKIVHEYDSAPDQPSGRNPINYKETLDAIQWIDTLTSAINEVITRS